MTSPGADETTLLAARYRLEEPVGSGSMGTVWRATDERLLRVVAVKQLLIQPGAPGYHPQGLQYGDAKQRILREGRLAARLQHPNTVGVYDVVLHDDVPWLVMEYLESRTLGALTVDEGPLEPRRAAEIGRQVADGLVAAHAAGIVHRDVKPSNVLIGADGSVKITDFGVSRAADDVQLTRTGLIAGTPAYLAPEVARGQTPTPASDVFALASTIYACVEGTPPFGLDDNTYAMLYTVGSGEVRAPTRAGPLAGTLMWMLDKDPQRRPSAATARDELARVAAGGQPSRPPSSAAVPPTLVSPVVPPSTAGPVRPMIPPPRQSLPGVRAAGGTRVDLRPPVGGRGGGPAGPGGADPGGADPGGTGPGGTGPDGSGPGGAGPGGSGPSGSGPMSVRPGRNRRALLPAVAAAVLLLAVVVGVAVAAPGSRPTVSPGSAATLPTSGATAAPRPAAPARPSTVDGQPSGEQLQAFVRDYYALLPGEVDRAWQLLGPTARQESGSLDSYRRFYGGLSGVRFADGPTAVDGRTVRATLLFDTPDRSATGGERYTFVVEPGPDGTLRMTSFSR